MATHVRSRQSARKAAIVAQAAAGVLVLSGAAMGFFGLPGLDPEKQTEPAVQPSPAGDQSQGTPTRPPADEIGPLHDPETVELSFSMLSNFPTPDPVVEPDPDDGPDVPEVDDIGVRYVGSIKVGGEAAAFMNIGGVTKLLRPGGKPYEGVRLVRVEGDSVVVSMNDAPERTIEKAARSGPAVSLVVGGAPAVKEPVTALSDDNPEPASFTPDMSREERRAALLERARSERSRWERQRGDGGGPPN